MTVGDLPKGALSDTTLFRCRQDSESQLKENKDELICLEVKKGRRNKMKSIIFLLPFMFLLAFF